MYSHIYFVLIVTMIIVFIIVLTTVLFKKFKKNSTVKLVDEIVNESPFRKSNNHFVKPHNDPLAKNKLLEEKKRQEIESGVSIYNPQGITEQEEVKIVGVVEPKGFWSKFIISQKLSYIMARVNMQNKQNGKGYWANLIKAQAASQGKDQGRGR